MKASPSASMRSRAKKAAGFEGFYVDVHKSDMAALRQMRMISKDADRDERQEVTALVFRAAMDIIKAELWPASLPMSERGTDPASVRKLKARVGRPSS